MSILACLVFANHLKVPCCITWYASWPIGPLCDSVKAYCVLTIIRTGFVVLCILLRFVCLVCMAQVSCCLGARALQSCCWCRVDCKLLALLSPCDILANSPLPLRMCSLFGQHCNLDQLMFDGGVAVDEHLQCGVLSCML